MLFAHLKRILRLGRLRLRGPLGAQDEFTLAATAQNLRRLAKLVAQPPPATTPCCRPAAAWTPPAARSGLEPTRRPRSAEPRWPFLVDVPLIIHQFSGCESEGPKKI